MNLKYILDPKKIKELFHAKAEYGQLFLFSSKDIVTVFRPLTIAESESVSVLHDKIHPLALEDWVFSTCFILSNKELDFLLNKTSISYVGNISKILLESSNIQDEKVYKKTLFTTRERTNTLQNVVEILIAKGYHSLSHRSIKNMTQVKQFELLGNAEVITGDKLDLGDRKKNKAHLREFIPGATVIGGDITSKEAADKPDFNETIE